MAISEADRQDSDASLADQAYRRIQQDILSGVFQPGEPLRLAALKDRYGLSFSPLREALTRLAGERLTELASLRGFRVASVSLNEMWDLIGSRVVIESEALRRAIAKGDLDWEAGLVASFHALGKAVEQRDTIEGQFDQALEHRHQAFHHALISACGSPSLLNIAGQLYMHNERYRRPTLSGELLAASGGRDVMGEHAELMDAALNRQVGLAVERLAAHYRRTGEQIEIGLRRAIAAE